MAELKDILRTVPTRFQELVTRLHRANQTHVFGWWDELTEGQRQKLLAQLQSIDLDLVTRLIKEHALQTPPPSEDITLEPLPVIPIPGTKAQIQGADEARELGESALRAGKVAIFVVAGGQGTRLDFPGPKGAFPIGPVTNRTLFQIHAEKIRALRKRYQTHIPWHIMTSEANDAQTRSFLGAHDYFGLPEEDVTVFAQRMLPAADDRGKLIMDEKDHLFLSPNGHGGSILALYESGALEDMKKQGIEEIFYFQVDNPLVKLADPIFLGYHLEAGAEMSSKVVSKRSPEEKVGVIGLVGGKPGVVEYSDLKVDDMYATNPDGSLKFSAGSIAIHLLNRAFVEELNRQGFKLPYHAAHKKVLYLDEAGERIEPDQPNATKFETFVFDALQFTTSTVVMEIDRAQEFSPVKNASGEDSPDTARRDLTAQYARWLHEAGIDVPRDHKGDIAIPIEISPLTALDAGDLKGRIPPGLRLGDALLI